MREGDIVYGPYKGQFLILKILRIDLEAKIYHCLMYKPVSQLPRLSDIPKLEVLAWHGPIDSAAIERDDVILGNIEVSQQDLVGYIFHLKHTNFHKYLSETHQDFDKVFQEATKYYRQGCELSEPNQRKEAIEAYTQAIDIYPYHFHALDNRGLTFMELGDFPNAIKDFQESLNISPKMMLPTFSIGECYYKLKDYKAALEFFEKANQIEPHNELVEKWLKLTKARIDANK